MTDADASPPSSPPGSKPVVLSWYDLDALRYACIRLELVAITDYERDNVRQLRALLHRAS